VNVDTCEDTGGKLPWSKWFNGDYLRDPTVTALSPAARGIWMDFLCVMMEGDRSGVIVGNRAMLSRLARCSTDEVSSALNEIQMCKTGDVIEADNGFVTVINRRMKREYDKRKSGAMRQERFREKQSGNAGVTPLSRDRLQNLESESDNSDKAFKLDAPVANGGRGKAGLTARQIEVAQFGESVLNGEWVNDAGKWVTRIKQDAEKVFRVMADVKAAKVEGRVKTTPARMAEFNWGVFK
jgi:hypothetical protein